MLFQFGVSMSLSRGGLTKIVELSPYYVVVNDTDTVLWLEEPGVENADIVELQAQTVSCVVHSHISKVHHMPAFRFRQNVSIFDSVWLLSYIVIILYSYGII